MVVKNNIEYEDATKLSSYVSVEDSLHSSKFMSRYEKVTGGDGVAF
jgi:hypothetical protein